MLWQAQRSRPAQCRLARRLRSGCVTVRSVTELGAMQPADRRPPAATTSASQSGPGPLGAERLDPSLPMRSVRPAGSVRSFRIQVSARAPSSRRASTRSVHSGGRVGRQGLQQLVGRREASERSSCSLDQAEADVGLAHVRDDQIGVDRRASSGCWGALPRPASTSPRSARRRGTPHGAGWRRTAEDQRDVAPCDQIARCGRRASRRALTPRRSRRCTSASRTTGTFPTTTGGGCG